MKTILDKHRLWCVIIMIMLVCSAVNGQEAAWWEPSTPLIGQQFTVYYDDEIGTLPAGSDECWLHWGVVDPVTGDWSEPPESIWPPGSQSAPQGFACQSPMVRGTDDIWYVDIDPLLTIEIVEFVFTDMNENWDNNNNANWRITFITGDIVSWWYPEEPLPGDLVAVYYNAAAGTIPTSSDNIKLHWGINEYGFGNWQEPPSSMWPPNTVPWGDDKAVQSPLIPQGDDIWSIEIQTNDTTLTLHYVFTDGINWDGNNGLNWNIILEEPPPPVYSYHRFYYDTRSAFETVGLENITSVNVAGTFNGWSMTATPLTGPDERGVFTTEQLLPLGSNEYKFVINGNNWVQDPDNPLIASDPYIAGNSKVFITPEDAPHFTQIYPFENTIFDIGETVEISAIVRPSDTGPGILGIPIIRHNGISLPVEFNLITGEITASINLLSEGFHLIDISAQDSAGTEGDYLMFYGAYSSTGGFNAIDTRYDDTGGGGYTYPGGMDGVADLLGMWMWEQAAGDSIGFEILVEDITDETRVMLQICTEVDGFYFDSPLFENEVNTAEWNGNGVQLCLVDPSSAYYDPDLHNVLIIHRDPVELGNEVNVYQDIPNRLYFALSTADLESVMGSYNRGWYYGVYSFIAGPEGTSGNSWEIDAMHGGLEEDYDPDIYDAMFFNDRDLQNTIFSNFSGNRRCTFDNLGRGFALIEPEDIGAGIGSSGPFIDILSRGAPTIVEDHSITGIGDFISPTTVTVYQEVGGSQYIHTIPGVTDTFEVEITLYEGDNTIWAEATEGSETGISPSVVFDLYVEHAPEPFIATSYASGIVTLDASASTDPEGQNLRFAWDADEDNPEPIVLINPNSAICTFNAPVTAGEYYVNLSVTDPDTNISHARTLATVYPDSVHPFEWDESVQWIRDAIIYEIYPRSYSASWQLSEITSDMERIANLGVNAIWLMPIYPGPSGHGYAIVDYYGIEEDYGTPEDFAELVDTAHDYDIRIILDMVINHSAIEHPFMQDAIQFGEYSHYYDYYDRDASGNYTYYYDWVHLPNLNYDNPDVWDYFIAMSKWWVEEYDVDGYRCDVAWGVQSRDPDFWIEWREELKKIKPEIFLLAEATSTDFTYFDYRFDSANDWNLHHEAPVNLTNLFPGPPNLDQLHEVITNYGYPYPQYHYPFRFMENHDESRYITFNTPDETKLCATLLLTIPGIPLIYSGQEIGVTSQRGLINWNSDPNQMGGHYNKLMQVRNLFPSVRGEEVERLNSNQNTTVYSIGRYVPGEFPVISVMNFASWSQVITVDVPVDDWGLQPDSLYCLNEFIGGTHFWYTGSELTTITTSIDAKKSRVYAITDSVVTLDAETIEITPQKFELAQNYPNPFNPDCIIRFEVPVMMKVNITIFNILGQKVNVLTDKLYDAGSHALKWDGRTEGGAELSSGIYFYRMTTESFHNTKKMVLIR